MSADKIAKFQAKVAKEVNKMQELMSNATLMSTCQTLGITVAATASTTNTSTSSAASTGGKTTSAAVNVKSLAGGQILALVSAFVYALTML